MLVDGKCEILMQYVASLWSSARNMSRRHFAQCGDLHIVRLCDACWTDDVL